MSDEPTPEERQRRADFRRKSALAFGVAAICVMFILETVQAHRVQPHPASPFIWATLGAVATVGTALGLWFRRKARALG